MTLNLADPSALTELRQFVDAVYASINETQPANEHIREQLQRGMSADAYEASPVKAFHEAYANSLFPVRNMARLASEAMGTLADTAQAGVTAEEQRRRAMTLVEAFLSVVANVKMDPLFGHEGTKLEIIQRTFPSLEQAVLDQRRILETDNRIEDSARLQQQLETLKEGLKAFYPLIDQAAELSSRFIVPDRPIS